MKVFKHLKDAKKKYLLIPVMPTPNGGMHLGHLSGPYLKMDILARAQRRNGNEVSCFFGTDVYESYMNLKAWQTGKDESLLCDENNRRIKDDLDALKIEYNDFINPLDEKHLENFTTFLTTALDELVAEGVTEIRLEKYLYAEEQDCFVAGCWITGNCPVCGSGSGSYQCEDCGTQYRPMDLISPSFRRGDYPLTEVNDKELYLVVRKKDQLFQHLESMQIGYEFIEIVKTYFKEQGNYIRLTNPGKWGIPYQLKDSSNPHVIFTYTALYFYSLYCGELYKNKSNTLVNPFDKQSDVITIASFGIDCTVPYLAGVALGLEGNKYKPIDFLLPNHFFTLENAKFSTSRGHAIWGADIINKTSVNVDAVRYFLVLNNPEDAMADFSVDAFIQFVNDELVNKLQHILTKAWAALQEINTGDPNPQLITQLETLLIEQNDYLTPPGFQLKESSNPLEVWINDSDKILFNSNNAYWWLKGLALLAFPIMPDTSTAVWHLLGHEGQPVERNYFLTTKVNIGKEMPLFFKAITFEDIRPALPTTLFAKEFN